MSSFKLVIIVWLVIIFGIGLKALRDLFFQYVVCDQGRYKGTQFFGGGDIQQKGKFKLLVLQGDPLPQFSPLVRHLNLPIRKTLKGAWSAHSNDFENSEWEYFLSKQQIYSM